MLIPLPEDQPVMPLWPDGARALGYGRSRAYAEARNGSFPIEILHIGAKLAIRTADLRRHLRLDVPAGPPRSEPANI